jgi:threonine/homoserine/homoserine lactone efflux protein
VGSVLAPLLASAVAFAFSPIPIIELILVVFSRRARVNGVVFLLTVALPTFVIPLLGATLVKDAAGGGSGDSGAGAWVNLAFGVLLLLLAVVNLRKYNDTSAPKVFGVIEGMGPGAVFGLAIGVTLVNPKNLALLLSAGETLREASLAGAQMLLAVALFTLVAMLPYLLVIAYQNLGGKDAAARLDSLKSTLLRNNHKVMFWVCLVIGLVMGGRGVAGLLG